MNKEELKEYFKRTEELEKKLTGEDKKTIQWMIYGYNQCAKKYFETLKELDKYKNIIDELEKYLNEVPNNNADNIQYGRESLAEDLQDLIKELKGE